MNIGFDIDDTITNSSDVFIKYAKEYNYLKGITYLIDKDKLDQEQAFGWNENNKTEFKKLYLKKILNETVPNKDVVKVLTYLKNRGYKIFLISARNDEEIPNMYDFTREWLFINKITYDKLIVNANDKLIICRKNKIKLFVDDNSNICRNIYNQSDIKVLLYTTRYNKRVKNECVRVNDWKEILSYIINIERKKV